MPERSVIGKVNSETAESIAAARRVSVAQQVKRQRKQPPIADEALGPVARTDGGDWFGGTAVRRARAAGHHRGGEL